MGFWSDPAGTLLIFTLQIFQSTLIKTIHVATFQRFKEKCNYFVLEKGATFMKGRAKRTVQTMQVIL